MTHLSSVDSALVNDKFTGVLTSGVRLFFCLGQNDRACLPRQTRTRAARMNAARLSAAVPFAGASPGCRASVSCPAGCLAASSCRTPHPPADRRACVEWIGVLRQNLSRVMGRRSSLRIMRFVLAGQSIPTTQTTQPANLTRLPIFNVIEIA